MKGAAPCVPREVRVGRLLHAIRGTPGGVVSRSVAWEGAARGLRTGDPVPRGAVLLGLPPPLILGTDACRDWDGACATLARGLLDARPDTFAGLYASALPGALDLAALPLAFDPAKARAWAGARSPTGAFALGLDALHAAFSAACPEPEHAPEPGSGRGPPSEGPSDLRLAFSAVSSRAFRLDSGAVALLPAIDLANHRSVRPSCAWEEDGRGGVRLVARKALEPGAALEISYGSVGRSSLDVFLQYGFCPTDLPGDRLQVFASASSCLAWASRGGKGEPLDDDEAPLREGDKPLHVFLERGRPRGRLTLELALVNALHEAGVHDLAAAARQRLSELVTEADAWILAAGCEPGAPGVLASVEDVQREACMRWGAHHARVLREALAARCAVGGEEGRVAG